MFDESLIVRSGQGWKALLVLCGSMLSLGSLLTGFLLLDDQPALAVFFILGGVGIFVGSMLFACISIRCPHCGARWVWLSLKQEDVGDWLVAVVAQRVCRVCQRSAVLPWR